MKEWKGVAVALLPLAQTLWGRLLQVSVSLLLSNCVETVNL